MKYLLILMFAVLFAAEVCTSSFNKEWPSDREKIQSALLRELRKFARFDIREACPRQLTDDEHLFSSGKYDEFINCANSTIVQFMAKLNEDPIFIEPENMGQLIRQFAEPTCALANEIFGCIRGFEPVIDLCLNEQQQIFKTKLFGIVPLMGQSLCVRTGGLISDIILHGDGIKCVAGALESLDHIRFVELFESDSTTVLFGNEDVCRKGSEVLQEIYAKVGECSVDVLAMVKDMLGYICERTPCNNYIQDLQCY